tara:strand:+ start:103 stop:882 length:780 start_codon:yes stop_codon:yes gene_type:complete
MKNNILSLINKDIISLILAIFFSSIIFLSNDSKYVEKIEQDIVDFVSILSSPKKWYKEILIIKEKNDLLIKKITQLQLLVATYDNYRLENEELKAMLDFQDSYGKLSLKPANIVNHNFSSSVYSVIIDVGKDDKIGKNQAVLDMNGLFGKTITVGEKASKVQTITDKNFAVSVKVGTNQILSIFKPSHGKYGTLEGVIKSSDVSVGDIVYTSGVSEIYPANLPVAKVIKVKKEKDKPFQDVIVEILADFKNLNYVFVIK